MGSAERTRETWLDGLKGFGCLLVILGHVLSGYLDAGAFPEAYGGLHSLRTWIYSFHMPLFFLISGFTFTLAYFRDGKLRRAGFLRQLCNLVWVYVLFALLLWLVKQAVPEMVNEAYDLSDLLGMFRTPLGNFWYVYVLFFLYLIGAVTGLSGRTPVWLLPLGALSVYAAHSSWEWTALTFYRLCYHLFFFAWGCMLCRNRKWLESPKILGISAMLLATAAYFYFFWYTRNWYAVWQFLIAAATCWVLVWQFHRFPRLSGCKLFQNYGKYALEIYLLHTFFTGGLRALLPLLGITTPFLSVWFNFLFSAGASYLLSVLLHRCRIGDLLFRPARYIQKKTSGESGSLSETK